VLGACTADEAEQVFMQEAGRFDLIVSDVVLTDRSGIKAVEQMFEKLPRVPVLFVSGYTDDKSGWDIIREKGYQFLQKPYTVEQLLENMRKAMTTHPQA
jgi:two-component system cell cycle sensor histidine kinase/response regulator CckA